MADQDISKIRLERPKTGYSKGKRGRKRILLAAVLITISIGLFLLWQSLRVPAVRASTVALAYPSQAVTVLNSSGYVVAERKAALASKTTGRLVWLGVEEGSRVEAGEVVARLENDDLSAALDQARSSVRAAAENLASLEAELEDADDDFRRKEMLLKEGFVSRSVFDAAEARLKKARAGVEAGRAQAASSRAALRGAEASLGYTYIRAPFSGVVLTKNADIGDIVTPIGASADAKAAVVTIADLGSLQVETDVSEANISKVAKGMACEIQLDALPDERFDGSVHMIVPTADRTKASVLVKVRFARKDPRVLPEMSAKVAFLSRPLAADERAPRVAVPRDAVVTRDGKAAVFVIEGGRVSAREVSTGKPIGDSVEVSGLSPGQTVVVSPPEGLGDDERVKLLEE